MSNLILDKLPGKLIIRGAEYRIDTDFRTSILFELMMDDEELSDTEKAEEMFNLYFRFEKPEFCDETISQILWFYRGGQEERKGTGGGPALDPVYSFEHDDIYIYAAFMEQYGIDLTTIKYMHWWKFKALLVSLNDNILFSKIMGYRAVKLDKVPKERRKFYQEMKRIYALPKSKTMQEKIDAIQEALMKGEDISGLLGNT